MKEIKKTGRYIRTPRGEFTEVANTVQEMKEHDFGEHHRSDDRQHIIMGNGKIAYAVRNK